VADAKLAPQITWNPSATRWIIDARDRVTIWTDSLPHVADVRQDQNMDHSLPRVYFARAIDGENEETRMTLVSIVAAELAVRNLQLVDPVATEPNDRDIQDTETIQKYRNIVDHDLSILRTCDAVLMDMSIPNRNYIGCVCELTYAYLWSIPCIVYIGQGNSNRPWLHYHATAIFKSRKAAVAHLADLLQSSLGMPRSCASAGHKLLDSHKRHRKDERKEK
jgi:nucleoside 2-deoxyribosyltransferase